MSKTSNRKKFNSKSEIVKVNILNTCILLASDDSLLETSSLD